MFYGIVVRMYFHPGEHPPPHFPAYYGEHKAKISIPDGGLLDGSLPRRQLRLVTAWADLHADDLQANWNLVMNGEVPFRIQPLQ